jgi:hypothetical protein
MGHPFGAEAYFTTMNKFVHTGSDEPTASRFRGLWLSV